MLYKVIQCSNRNSLCSLCYVKTVYMKISMGLIFLLLRPIRGGGIESEQAAASASVELRFAYSLLEKLIQYLDTASINMKLLKPSSIFSRRNSFKTSTRDIKFFSKVSFAYLKIFRKKDNKIRYICVSWIIKKWSSICQTHEQNIKL
jgi:hypothetical protein